MSKYRLYETMDDMYSLSVPYLFDTLSLSMDQALNIARIFSIDAIVARNTLQIAYWSYRNYKADLLPGMVLDGTLPSLDKSLSSYQKEDGTYAFDKLGVEIKGKIVEYRHYL